MSLGIARLPSLMHSLARQAEIGSGGNGVPGWNAFLCPVMRSDDLAPDLRSIVLVGQPALRAMRARQEGPGGNR